MTSSPPEKESKVSDYSVEVGSVTSSDGQIRGVDLDLDQLQLAKSRYEPGFLWFLRGKIRDPQMDQVATQPSVFDDPDKKERFWPGPKYENLHRFDVSARWTWREEYKLIQKIDFRVMIWACIMFFCLELDRSNLTQANSDNFLPDLGLTTDDFNNGNTIFRASFLAAELPSQLISKRVGPDRWIPAQIVLWSFVATFQFFLSGRTSFYITRMLLGVMQGGFIPDVILYLSYFYTGKELTVRCSFFWVFMYVADICSAFLGFGILHLRGVHGKSGWRWLFLIEGLLTMTVGLISMGMMPSSPTSTKGWLRGKNGWFNEREEVILTSRVLRDDPNKGDMHNREGITFRLLWKSIKDYHLWPMYLIGVAFSIPQGPPSTYLSLTLRNLGFSTFKTNLLTVPAYALNLINLLIISYLAEVMNNRILWAMMSQIWMLPCLIAVQTFGAQTNNWAKYVVTLLIVGYPYPHAIQVAWCSRNSNAVRTRTVSASLYNITVQLSNILQSQIYRASDAPLYHKGNRALLIVVCINIALYLSAYAYYRYVNHARDKIWKTMSDEQQRSYINDTKDEGSKRLDFRFSY